MPDFLVRKIPYRYLVVSILFLLWIVVYLQRVNIGILLVDERFLADMGITGQSAKQGLLMTLFLIPYALTNVIGAPIGDLLGPLMSAQKAAQLGIPVLATIVATATTGVDPDIMGIGPVSSSNLALQKAGLTLNDIELIELNEAFAAQYLACEKALGINREITNVNGSGISMGHPVGCSGTRIITSLLYEMKRRQVKYGMATLCAGGGMGTSIIIKL